MSARITGSATRGVVNKIHAKVHEVEHENVGVKATHRGELLGESAYHSGKRTVQRAYRFHKNRPYRKASKLQTKSIKAEAKLSYQRDLRDAPTKKNALSRFFQKRRIKRQYAAAFRNAKKSGKMAKKSAGIVGKASKLVTNLDSVTEKAIERTINESMQNVTTIRTKKMIVDPVTAEHVRLMYEMYARPNTSFGDIIRHFMESGITVDGIELTRSQISYMLKNPVYVQADLDVYDVFKGHGADVVNEAADFTGTNGCYFYTGRGTTESKKAGLKDHTLVIAPHEGLVSSDIWLACRKKMMSNMKFPSQHKAKNTWLAGKVKCGRCGAGLMSKNNPKGNSYFRCRKRADARTCEGCGTLRVHEFEKSIYKEMVKKLRSFQSLTKGNPTKVNPKLTALNVELAQVDTEIEKLLDNLTGANATLLSYANSKIEELDTKRQSLLKAIADMKTSILSPEHAKSISGYLTNWDDVNFEDRRLVVDGLISRIQATSECVQIEWKV